MKAIVCLTTMLIFLSACSVYRIDGETKGILFYKKKGMTKQQTTYVRSWMEIKLDFAILAPDGKKISGKIIQDFC